MTTETKPLSPLLKYPGGKRREIPTILRYLPTFTGRYVEPFVGGGALFFHLNPEQAWINDLNKDLIRFYSTLADEELGPKTALQIQTLSENYNELTERGQLKRYLDSRRALNGDKVLYISPAEAYYIVNRLAFGGVVQVNSQGEYNVPFGKYKTLTNTITDSHLNLLKRTEITAVDYQTVLAGVKEGDFVFLDPPYDAQYTNYGNTEPFGKAEHINLAAQFRQIKGKALMTLNVTPLTQRLYEGLIEVAYSSQYSINRQVKNPDLTHHMIVTNY